MACDAMRVLHRDPKTGEIKVRVENADDLWHLHNLVLPGDLVRASTYRREEVKTDKVRPERGEKVRVTLTIRVESVEFQAFSDRLRITGVIVEGPQDLGRHHTLNIAVEDVLSVIKTWHPHELRRIEEAVAAGQKPLVAFLSLDDEEALSRSSANTEFGNWRQSVRPAMARCFRRETRDPYTLTRFSQSCAPWKSERRSSSWDPGSHATRSWNTSKRGSPPWPRKSIRTVRPTPGCKGFRRRSRQASARRCSETAGSGTRRGSSRRCLRRLRRTGRAHSDPRQLPKRSRPARSRPSS